MKPLPFAVRVAAGLAAVAVDEARKLPDQLAGLPVTVASQAFQLSIRVQQQLAGLAVKGDDALATLRPVEEKPEWATFDEDESDDLWMQEEQALAEQPPPQNKGIALPDYEQLSLAQVRGKMRRLSLTELEALLDYEREHDARPSFITMLTRRIDTVRNQP